jgi:hypothetical protein
MSNLSRKVLITMLAPLRDEETILSVHITNEVHGQVMANHPELPEEVAVEMREQLHIGVVRALPRAVEEGSAFLEESFSKEELEQVLTLLRSQLWGKLALLAQVPALRDFQLAIAKPMTDKVTANMQETRELLKEDAKDAQLLHDRAMNAAKQAREAGDELMALSLGADLVGNVNEC